MSKKLLALGIAATIISGCGQLDSGQVEESEVIRKTTSQKQDGAYLENIAVQWGGIERNAKLIGVSQGSIYFSTNGLNSFDYDYGAYLFETYEGEELLLVGKEEPMFIGKTYNVGFYKFRQVEDVTTIDLLELFLDVEKLDSSNVIISNIDKNFQGIMTDYDLKRK